MPPEGSVCDHRKWSIRGQGKTLRWRAHVILFQFTPDTITKDVWWAQNGTLQSVMEVMDNPEAQYPIIQRPC